MKPMGPITPTSLRICTTDETDASLFDDRLIVIMTLMDHAATLRTIAQQIKSVTHHSVFARTIRRHFHQSGMFTRHSLLRLSLTGTH
ncbi:hypothetical protein TNCV_384771 [Trichonephila clavipes]|nr:hypothetical protein TNCV_384771 [Trichonephila clavipes]